MGHPDGYDPSECCRGLIHRINLGRAVSFSGTARLLRTELCSPLLEGRRRLVAARNCQLSCSGAGCDVGARIKETTVPLPAAAEREDIIHGHAATQKLGDHRARRGRRTAELDQCHSRGLSASGFLVRASEGTLNDLRPGFRGTHPSRRADR